MTNYCRMLITKFLEIIRNSIVYIISTIKFSLRVNRWILYCHFRVEPKERDRNEKREYIEKISWRYMKERKKKRNNQTKVYISNKKENSIEAFRRGTHTHIHVRRVKCRARCIKCLKLSIILVTICSRVWSDAALLMNSFSLINQIALHYYWDYKQLI